MNTNKVIHEAMGFKWRELSGGKRQFQCSSTRVKFYDFVCVCCDGPQSACKNDNPDYTSPVNYCALMDWMRKGKVWFGFEVWLVEDHLKYELHDFNSLERKEQVNLIAEAIELGVLK